MTGRYCFHRCLSVNISGGGGGIAGIRFSGRGYPVSDFRRGWGGTRPQIFGGGGCGGVQGVPGLRFSGGAMGGKGGGQQGGTQSQIFGGEWGGAGGYPDSVKGKIFDTRFGLIHVQTGKKNFLSRDSPPPPPR